MDRFWQDVVHHLRGTGGPTPRVVAPAEFRKAMRLTGDYSDPPHHLETDALVIHKQDYRQLPRPYVREAIATMRPSLANEVFIVLQRGERAEAPDMEHLGTLSEVRAWAEEQPRMASSSGGNGRMAPVYVGGGRVLLQNANGQLMLVHGADTGITPHLIRDGYFDHNLTSYIQRTLRTGDTFIDVGANVGTYTLLAARAVGVDGRVLAFEANPAIAELLHENVVMNGLAPIARVERVAVSDTEGTAPIYLHSIRQGSSTMVKEVAQAAEREYGERLTVVDVPCRTLDALLSEAELERIDLLKIDVEGFELRVLLGGRQTISRHLPQMILEWHPSNTTPEDLQRINALLAEFGYSLRRVEENGATRVITAEELQQFKHSDVVAVPPVR